MKIKIIQNLLLIIILVSCLLGINNIFKNISYAQATVQTSQEIEIEGCLQWQDEVAD